MQVPKSLALAAMVVGIAGGSYGLASAAGGTSTRQRRPRRPPPRRLAAAELAAAVGRPAERRDAAHGRRPARVTAIAKAKVGGTVVRVETDADGHAAYEAHMTDASGNPVTVDVDSSFNVVGVEQRP